MIMGEQILVGTIFTIALVAFGIMYVINTERTLRRNNPNSKRVEPAKEESPVVDVDALKQMSNAELFKMGSEKGLPVYKSWSKGKLVDALANHH